MLRRRPPYAPITSEPSAEVIDFVTERATRRPEEEPYLGESIGATADSPALSRKQRGKAAYEHAMARAAGFRAEADFLANRPPAQNLDAEARAEADRVNHEAYLEHLGATVQPITEQPLDK